jgi:thimet oligopeptidase
MTKKQSRFSRTEPIRFEGLTGNFIASLTKDILKTTEKRAEAIRSIPRGRHDLSNTLLAWDLMFDRFNSALSVIYLLAYVHPDEEVISEAQKSISTLQKYWNELQMDEKIYRAFKQFSKSRHAKQLKPEFARFLSKQIRDYERNGLALPVSKRKQLTAIKNRISDLSLQFSSNIAAWEDDLIVSEDEIEGLPEDYKETRMMDDLKYKIDLSYPSFHPFMKYSRSDEARKKLYIKFKNRASDANLPLLRELLEERKKMAELLGYKTYASWEIEDKMAGTAQKVWEFEHSLTGKVKPKAQFDLEELIRAKQEYLDSAEENIINGWESAFYSNIVLKKKYQVDQEEVKQYFELNAVIEGILKISENLFGVTFKKADKGSTWHPEVIPFTVLKEKNLVGYFYLDMHPREKKYKHAACFSLVNGMSHSKENQLPVAALVCNFPKPTPSRPSLLPHSDVQTLFHEFGHLLHHLFSSTELSAQAGISTAHDFVEVPSQLFENWAWDYRSLSLFANHYKTGETLPKEIFSKMLAARNLGSGIHTLQQIFYGQLDMTLHDKFDPNASVSTTEIVRQLQNSITPFPFLDGTYMEASFDHLTGYAAGYYGYLWSKVFAEDLFSIFRQEGILSPEHGKKLLEAILSRGSTMDENEMLQAFLGREPDEKAFLESLGI